MSAKLVIVESPAKAKTISKFLGKEYKVLASMGHIRDLPKKTLGFDPENNFLPEYEIPKEKKKTISELKKQIKKDTDIYLATDEDREGEAISWHLIQALKIEKHKLERIVFHEITKDAILNALKNPRSLDQNLVDAQQARRILDRAVGYKLSPLLWKKIQRGLSAGRVQSTAVRIIVDREREIRAFRAEEYWKIKANHNNPKFSSDLVKINSKKLNITNEKDAAAATDEIEGQDLTVTKIEEKIGKRNPAAPFITSTLQQEAARKLGFSVKQTMVIAQQLYEGNFSIPGYSGGLITYMRTDSVNLAKSAIAQAKQVIEKEYGKDYALESGRVYKKKSKGAQEAHEAIRPVDLSKLPSSLKTHLDPKMLKLYDLIWKRTIASQMKEAQLANKTVNIELNAKNNYLFQSKGQTIVFPGFMKAYTEGSDNEEAALDGVEKILPELQEGQVLKDNEIIKEQCFTKPPARYTEASLVKKLESEGIGRPSTYAPTISTIQTRGYIEKNEDKKLVPTDIAELVNDFLVKHFQDIVDLGFTAKIEEDFDKIAEGKQSWQEMLKDFYQPLVDKIKDKESSVSREEVSKTREIGIDPQSQKPVYVKIGRFGPMVQIGHKDDEEKPRFASLPKNLKIDEVSLDEVLYLFDLPKTLGKNSEGKEVVVNIGRFGPYVKIDNQFYSIKEHDPYQINLEQALQVVSEQEKNKKKKEIKKFESEDIEVLNGPYGPYIKQQKKNYKIPKTYNAEELELKDCLEIIKNSKKK